MIARHSYEQSGDGEGVEVIENKECENAEHGKGQYTEKHIHLSRYRSAAKRTGKSIIIIGHSQYFSVVYHIGCRPFVHDYFMLSKNLGIIIHLPSQVSL